MLRGRAVQWAQAGAIAAGATFDEKLSLSASWSCADFQFLSLKSYSHPASRFFFLPTRYLCNFCDVKCAFSIQKEAES